MSGTMDEITPGRHLDGSDEGAEEVREDTTVLPVAGATLAARQQVVCPECGTTAQVTLNRREAGDFCPRCDFPLFWVRSEVLLDRSGAEDSLRRLPGTAGRLSVGSASCPACTEANPITATTCLRCGGPMELPPAPRFVAPAPPPPVPEPEPEPEPGAIWPWIVLGVGTALLVVAMVLYLLLR